MSGRPDADAPRVLIVRLGALGDIVHALPVAAALRRAWPSAAIDWLVDARHRHVLDLATGLDSILSWRSPRLMGVDGLLAVVRRLRRTRYDLALDLQGLLKSAVLARLSAATRVLGFGRAHLRESAARSFYTETVDPGQVAHVIEKNLSLLRPLGVRVMEPMFPMAEPPMGAAAAHVRAHAGAGPLVVLNVGAAWPNKQWPPPRLGAVARTVRDRRGCAVTVLWGPGDRALAEQAVAASQGAALLAPPSGLADVVAIARMARVFVSGDTGPMHLAAAVGTPVVGLFGPTSPTRNGPWGSSAAWQVSRFKDCACHYERRCTRARPCIDDIAVDDVVAAIESALDRREVAS